MSVQLGQTLSHYRLLEEIGKGGMGVVYKAHDSHLKREVAVKILPDGTFSDDVERRRFRKEALALSKLNHPNIQTVHDYDTQHGVDFLVTEYIPGITLRDKLAAGPLPAKELEDLGIQIAEGLIAAHEQGVVHRDLKPENLRLTPDRRMKILDFGLAKFAQPPSDFATTEVFEETRSVAGTLPYMSPEQLKGEPVDERIDIYAAGVVLFEMATGRRPFENRLATALAADIQTKPPPPPGRYNTELAPRMEDIILKCLEKDPDNRYQSARELLVDLRRLSLPHPETVAPVPAPAPPPRRTIQLRWLIIGGPVMILGLLLLNPAFRETVSGWIGIDPPFRTLAVLPFENVGGDADNQAFCDGLLETLTSNLTHLERFQGSLWVVPASEVRRRGITSPSEAREALGVNLVITGSVQPFENGFRQTMNLIDVDGDTPRQLDSSIIDSRIADISALQDETVVKIAGMLNFKMPNEAQQLFKAGRTTAAEAYEYYLQARGYLLRYEKMENIDHAIGLFQSAIEKDPGYALAYAGLGEAYLRKYEESQDVSWVEHATNSCNQAYEISSSLAPVHVTLGMLHEATGKYEEAISEFQQAIALDPANDTAYTGLAKAYADLERDEEAEATFKEAILAKPNYWGAYKALGNHYLDHGRYDEAIEQYQRALELTPDNSSVYNALGGAYYKQDRWAKAREMYLRSLEIEPIYRTYSNLGALYYIEGDYNNAAAMTEKALELSDDNYGMWANLSNAYYWIPGKRERAIELYHRTAEMAEEQWRLDPRDSVVLADLASYYAIIGDGGKAIPFIQQALAISPDDMWVVYCASHTYEQLGDRERALEWMGKAIDMGYSQREIEHDPFLAELRRDERFEKLLGKDGGID